MQTYLDRKRSSAKKPWKPMLLAYVGHVGAVMQVKTGPTNDTGQGGVHRT
jgi:hypothetical protein